MTDVQVFSAATMSVVLFTAAGAKLRAPGNFRRALESYKVVPEAAIPALVVAVPLAEIGFGLLQWVSRLQPLVGIGMASMFVVFTGLLVRSLVAGDRADCGCFGSVTPERVSLFSVLRNLVLIAIALAGATATAGGSEGAIGAGLTGLGAGLLVVLAEHAFALVANTGNGPTP